MNAIYLLIPIALILVVVGVVVFFWAIKSDQFDDLEGPAHSILFDDDKTITPKQTKEQKKTSSSTSDSAPPSEKP